jgi:hypothetical protein
MGITVATGPAIVARFARTAQALDDGIAFLDSAVPGFRAG